MTDELDKFQRDAKRAEQRRVMLNNPVVYRQIMQTAELLEKELTPTTETLVDIPTGSEFVDRESKTVYVLEATATPIQHSDLIRLICEAAKKPVEDMPTMTYFLIRVKNEIKPGLIVEGEAPPPAPLGPLMVISGIDFVNYFAIGKWQLRDTPVKRDPLEFAGDKSALDRLDIHQPGFTASRKAMSFDRDSGDKT